MLRNKIAIVFIGLLLLLSNCSTVLTSGSYYKTKDDFFIHHFGYMELESEKHLEKLLPNIEDVFDNAITNTFYKYGLDSLKFVEHEFEYDSLSKDSIKAICQQYNVDGLLVSRLHPKQINNMEFFNREAFYGLNEVKSNGIEMEMKLFDGNGKLLIKMSDIRDFEPITTKLKYQETLKAMTFKVTKAILDAVTSLHVYKH